MKLEIGERKTKTEPEIILRLTPQDVINLRVDIIEKLILKRKKGDPLFVFNLYEVLCKMEDLEGYYEDEEE